MLRKHRWTDIYLLVLYSNMAQAIWAFFFFTQVLLSKWKLLDTDQDVWEKGRGRGREGERTGWVGRKKWKENIFAGKVCKVR